MKVNCVYCKENFRRKRRSQKYCSASCRTMACYKRNGYEYVSGGYKENNKLRRVKFQAEEKKLPKVPNSQLSNLLLEKEDKVFDTKSMLNTVTSNLISESAIYGFKKIFNPTALPVTKRDIDNVLLQIQALQKVLAEIEFKNKYRI